MPNDVINTVTIHGTTYGIGGSGGHTIKNPAGTAMTQRSNLQFVDLTISDDSTNDATKVESVHVIHSESELDNLPDGLYMLDEDEETVIDGNLVGYDNTTSGLNAENVQDAIDEVVETLDDKIDISAKGVANGVAELDENGKVPSSQLPSYIDDVIEVADYDHLPATGESGKIYVALDTNKTYRWGGTEYVEISESLALGETSSTAYRGDRGKTAYDHSQITSGNPHNVTKSDVGLGNVNNTSDKNKPLSDATKEALLMKLGVEALTNYYETSMIVEMPYEAGKIVYVEQEGRLYRTTTSINIGDTLVPDTNCVHVDIEYLLLEKLGVDNLTTVVELVDRASSAHSMYSRFYIAYLNKWAKATANIAINDMLVMGTNYEIVTIEDVFGSIESVLSQMSTSISNKVNKETGKGLSTNDYTTTDKNKVATIDNKADKVSGATNGNLAGLNGSGNLTDSGWNGAKDTTSISGNPISISGLKANQLAKNPIITFEPIQDLHGQSKPYPAGGGKNLIPLTVEQIKNISQSGSWSGNTFTPSGSSGTITIVTDSANNVIGFKVNGTFSNTIFYLFGGWYGLSKGTSYIINGGSSTASVRITDNITNTYADYTGAGTTFTLGNDFNTPTGFLYINAGTWSNVIVKPMICLATESDTTFAPYENICPISGYDKVEALSCGKNLFDGTYSSAGKFLQADGSEYAGAFNISQYISVKSNTAYYFSNLSGATSACICWYNKAKEFISATNIIEAFTATSPANACYVRASVHNTRTNVCINEGNSAITYVPYNKATSISESLGQTVYGGSLDVRTGKLRVTHKMVDMGNLNWYYQGSTWQRFYSDSVADMKNTVIDTEDGCLSEIFVTSRAPLGGSDAGDCAICLYNTVPYARWLQYNSDEAGFKTAVTGKKLIYELSDSAKFTIQLTPHEISLLKDYAYISTNGTNIALDYHNGELASLADISQLGETVNELGDRFLYSKHITKALGNVTANTRYEYFITDDYPYINENTLKSISLTPVIGNSALDYTATLFWTFYQGKVSVIYYCNVTQSNAYLKILVLY